MVSNRNSIVNPSLILKQYKEGSNEKRTFVLDEESESEDSSYPGPAHEQSWL